MKTRQQRVIEGLKWVTAAKPPPFDGKPKKLKGMPAKGKAYEKKVGLHLKQLVEDGLPGELWIGPWFCFEDTNGKGMAQPDALLFRKDRVLIIEAKLKQSPAAIPQLLLYGTLAEALLEVPWVGVQVFKFPSTKRDDTWIDTLSTSLEPRRIYNWHQLL